MNMHRYKKYLLFIFIVNICPIWAMEKKHTIKIQVTYTATGPRSLESYYARCEKLEQIARSYEDVNKVKISPLGYQVDMIVKQKALSKKKIAGKCSESCI